METSCFVQFFFERIFLVNYLLELGKLLCQIKSGHILESTQTFQLFISLGQKLFQGDYLPSPFALQIGSILHKLSLLWSGC